MKKTVFVLAYALIAVSIFAFTKTTENNKLSLALSNEYAMKMADASDKLGELDKAVKQTLLFNHSEGSKKAREDIWRLSSDIKSSIASLPLDASFTTSWMNYLSRIGNYAKEADRAEQPDEYYKVMSQASNNLGAMQGDWQLATAGLLDGQYSMGEWTRKLDTSNPNFDWSNMGASIKSYTESDFPLTASESDAMKKKELKHIEDAKVTQAEAIDRFKTLFPNVSNDVIGVEMSKPGSPYPFFHIRFADRESIGYIDITEKGGHVLSYLSERPFGKASLSFDDIKKRAEDFLKNADYKDLVYQESRENNTAWHFVFVRKEPFYGAKVFSDVIHLKVAKDNGDIIGLDASEYIRKEQLARQAIKKIDWKEFFHKDVQVVEDELAYVENERLEQRLTHYLTVTRDENGHTGTYTVIVDTETAEVIKTEKLD
ncbi:germination protein YpeB [Sporosarcina thermotolerans]|uniref:Germination protein YpeB n=1 Tax=Sporosarcina thermotolerans TaxID=633404 RepID=A0AAW9A5V2_9BACL|nr:PepSY1/2 domain-containing protein [Sporosarcina thermotolerans]MDW0115575.1 germination protein YpeB [Sporosarcina thermotolerans]